MTSFDLVPSVHVFQRNPVGHSWRPSNLGPAMAPSPRGREIFRPVSVKALRIAFRRKNSVDMREIPKRAQRGVRLIDRESIDSFMENEGIRHGADRLPNHKS
jgi:hypothetical protein